ncbi:MAG: hypothetical protein ACRD5H_10795, partial [Nitrososphaerales archaeon]
MSVLLVIVALGLTALGGSVIYLVYSSVAWMDIAGGPEAVSARKLKPPASEKSGSKSSAIQNWEIAFDLKQCEEGSFEIIHQGPYPANFRLQNNKLLVEIPKEVKVEDFNRYFVIFKRGDTELQQIPLDLAMGDKQPEGKPRSLSGFSLSCSQPATRSPAPTSTTDIKDWEITLQLQEDLEEGLPDVSGYSEGVDCGRLEKDNLRVVVSEKGGIECKRLNGSNNIWQITFRQAIDVEKRRTSLIIIKDTDGKILKGYFLKDAVGAQMRDLASNGRVNVILPIHLAPEPSSGFAYLVAIIISIIISIIVFFLGYSVLRWVRKNGWPVVRTSGNRRASPRNVRSDRVGGHNEELKYLEIKQASTHG